MLVQFSLKNVLSFKERTVLDMTAVSAYKEHPDNLIDIGLKEKFLRVTAIYGANASGKSNLNLAMFYFGNIIRGSFDNVRNGESTVIKKYYKPFLFDEEKNEDSEFEVVEILDGFEYRYGFEYNANSIEAEWLYGKNLKTNKRSTIFERSRSEISFGATVRKECSLYQKQIPKETLVLSFFNKLTLKTGVFQKVYSGILDTLVIQADFCEDRSLLEALLPRVIDNEKEKLLKFLSAIDVGIRDIRYEDSDNKVRFITYHRGKDGEDHPLPLYYESEGTIKSILLFIYAQIALKSNASMFVDELYAKLHPLLFKFIIDLFYDERSKAQLIYTTHDPTLMDKRFFRRDQIWFVDKDENGCSKLVALSDYKIRSDASFKKDYLAGVYGGIPLLKEFDMKEGE